MAKTLTPERLDWLTRPCGEPDTAEWEPDEDDEYRLWLQDRDDAAADAEDETW